MKTKKNKKYKTGGQLTKCLYHPVIDISKHTEMEDQELDETILKQIQDIDVSKIDILHILIGGTCTEEVPEASHKKYFRDCRESYSVIRSYTDNYFFINIDPRTTPGRNPKNYLHLKYFHSKEPDCMYNLQLKELIEKVLERDNTIVIIDNHIFLYLSSDSYISYLKPFAKFNLDYNSVLGKNGRFKLKYLPHNQPTVDDTYLNLTPEQKNRIIFTGYLKSHTIIPPGKFGDSIGKKYIIEYYLFLCKKLNITNENVKSFIRSRKINSLEIKYPDILRLLIEVKLTELKIPFGSFILSPYNKIYIPENDPKFCSI